MCDYEESYRYTFGDRIERLIKNEVNKRVSEKNKQLELDNKAFKDAMWTAKKAERNALTQLESFDKKLQKVEREAVKQAQRDFWFDCAIGDTVYIVKLNCKQKQCDRCGGKHNIKIIVDGVEVNAECPICGTYEKRKSLETHEYSIKTGTVERLQIEMIESRKWIKLWLKNEDYEYDLSYNKVFRTMEEAEAKLKEIQEAANERT